MDHSHNPNSRNYYSNSFYWEKIFLFLRHKSNRHSIRTILRQNPRHNYYHHSIHYQNYHYNTLHHNYHYHSSFDSHNCHYKFDHQHINHQTVLISSRYNQILKQEVLLIFEFSSVVKFYFKQFKLGLLPIDAAIYYFCSSFLVKENLKYIFKIIKC